VPAELSSPIPSALTQLADAVPLQVAEAGHLLAYLATVPDPRAARGRRHPLVAILAMAAAAVLTGARSMTAIAEWAADAPQPVREALGARRDAPAHWVVLCEATIRRDGCKRLAWHNVPVLDRTRDQADGRVASAPSRRSAWVAWEASRTPPRSSR
jgi:DDE_Tnp_1-associated